MTTWQRSHSFPSEVACEQPEIPSGLTIREWRQLDTPKPPAAATPSAVVVIQMSGYRVIVTEHRTRGLVGSDGTIYIRPPQSELQARSLIARVAPAAGGDGPWRQPVPTDQRIIELARLC
ncbi:MAG: hypothetical protein WAU75_21625 [Solirubrobacteraceae bacterium]